MYDIYESFTKKLLALGSTFNLFDSNPPIHRTEILGLRTNGTLVETQTLSDGRVSWFVVSEKPILSVRRRYPKKVPFVNTLLIQFCES